ncbi:MAG: hypothetical protein M3R04_01740 [bacterium]|nr:hypothetical protein [bacterium]
MRSAGKRSRGAAVLGTLVLVVTAAIIIAVAGLLLRKNADPGIRVWLLNHQPDQALIVNPFNGQVEQKFLVADGLRELAFNGDYTRAYIASVVDVANRLKVLDTRSYLQVDNIEVDGIPQGIGVFPDDKKLAVILGSKTDFMAGGFDVIDLEERSTSQPHMRKRLYRERGLSLSHKLAVGDDGDRIYVIDAKKPLVNVYSLREKKFIKSVDLRGAPEEMLYPRQGDSYYVSVLDHLAVYQISKKTDEIMRAYVPLAMGPLDPMAIREKIRFIGIDSEANYLFSSALRSQTVYVWQIGNPDHRVDWGVVARTLKTTAFETNESFQITQEQFLPHTSFKLKGGYNSNLGYVGGPERLAVDSMDQNLFVVDEDGALYVYDFNDVVRAKAGSVIEPFHIVMGTEGEMRDLKVSRPAVAVEKNADGEGS